MSNQASDGHPGVGPATLPSADAVGSPRQLSTLDRWLPAWIGLAMVAGLALGRFVPALGEVLARLEVGGISLPQRGSTRS